MPRNLRIEYPGAIYHVINRGNYRDAIFSTEAIKKVFEETLFAACERSSWILHAHTLLDFKKGLLEEEQIQWIESVGKETSRDLRTKFP